MAIENLRLYFSMQMQFEPPNDHAPLGLTSQTELERPLHHIQSSGSTLLSTVQQYHYYFAEFFTLGSVYLMRQPSPNIIGALRLLDIALQFPIVECTSCQACRPYVSLSNPHPPTLPTQHFFQAAAKALRLIYSHFTFKEVWSYIMLSFIYMEKNCLVALSDSFRV